MGVFIRLVMVIGKKKKQSKWELFVFWILLSYDHTLQKEIYFVCSESSTKLKSLCNIELTLN